MSPSWLNNMFAVGSRARDLQHVSYLFMPSISQPSSTRYPCEHTCSQKVPTMASVAAAVPSAQPVSAQSRRNSAPSGVNPDALSLEVMEGRYKCACTCSNPPAPQSSSIHSPAGRLAKWTSHQPHRPRGHLEAAGRWQALPSICLQCLSNT